jgi:hypothetical protein
MRGPVGLIAGRCASLAVLAAVLVGGCGGSQTLSSGELHVQATQLCTQASLETGRIRTPATPTGSVAFLQRGIEVMTPELAKLRALRPASDVADVYSTSITAFTKKLAAMKDAVRDLNGGEDPIVAVKTLEQSVGPLVVAENGAWQALQLPACVSR